MNLSELRASIKRDSKINIEKLDYDSVEAPYIYSKYADILVDEKMKMKKLENKMKKLYKETVEYYRGNASPEVYQDRPMPEITILKSQIPNYVEADEFIQELQDRIDLQEIKLDLINDMMKSLYQRSFHIGNAIKFIKFKNGEV